MLDHRYIKIGTKSMLVNISEIICRKIYRFFSYIKHIVYSAIMQLHHQYRLYLVRIEIITSTMNADLS